MSWVLCVVR